MLSVYSNQQDLLKATSTVPVARIEAIDSDLLTTRQFSITFDNGTNPNLELHVYTPDGIYLTGNHKTLFTIENNDVSSQKSTYQYLSVNSSSELETLGINTGQYRLVYNVFDNVIGSYDGQKLWIKEVSPSRREIRIQLSDNNGYTLRDQFLKLKDLWNSSTSTNIFNSFVLNFGFNETYQIVNMRFDNTPNPEIIVKLYQPLPANYGEKSKLWISKEIITPLMDYVSVVPKHIPEPVNNLAAANFDLEAYDGQSIATDFKSWNELLAANTQTSQQLIDSQFSGSLSGIKLNINYRCFKNFVHYSSAVERVKNFKYKLELIEYYTGQILTVANIPVTGSVIQTNLTDLYTKRNRIVSGFDNFEKYLFFESTGSKLYTHYDECSGSAVDPWPKKEATQLQWYEAAALWSSAVALWTNVPTSLVDPYNYFDLQETTTSAIATEYYLDLLEKAEIYDRYNVHKLQNTIPIHLQNLESSEDFLLFVNMLGQHFDILWTYINSLTAIQAREEHPKDGMPNDLLYHVASSLGFELLNGKSSSELWRYSLGVNASGSAYQTNNGGITSISDEESTKEVWRRVVNNLPYILKSKGTSRSIKALLSCFGIPTSVLTIKEYGGPSTFTDNDHYPEYVHDVYHYAWLSTTGSLRIPATTYQNGYGSSAAATTLEFRFKTDNNFTYNVGTSYTIFSSVSSSLTLTKETNDDNQGTLTYISNNKSGSISNLEIFDNSWQHIVIDNITPSSASLYIAKSLYGKSIYVQSASFATGSGNFVLAETINFASGSSKLFGHFHEIRLWSGSLNVATIKEHAASPATYTYNVDRAALTTGEEAGAPYTHLLQRFTLANLVILSGSFYQNSVHPNQKINTGSIYFDGYETSGSIDFEGFEETYHTPSPSLGGNSLYTNKVRIESSSLDPNKRLNTKTRIEKSSFDRYSIDSNRLGVYFSPQTAINEDIFNQLGYFEIDDYIGNPGDTYNTFYSDLTNFAISYWKKYENRNDFEAYFRALEIYDFTLFKYIKRLLPQRTNAIVGLVVEPNVLERSKVKLLNKPVIEDLKKDATIDAKNDTSASAAYQSLVGTIAASSSLDLRDTSIFPSLQGILSSSAEISAIISDTDPGVIENIIIVDRLGTSWQENRYIGKSKIRESGSYTPIQTIISASRPSTYLKELKTITSNVTVYATQAFQSGSAQVWGDQINTILNDDVNVTTASLSTTGVKTNYLGSTTYNIPDINVNSTLIGTQITVYGRTFGDNIAPYEVGIAFATSSLSLVATAMIDETNKRLGPGILTTQSYYVASEIPLTSYNIDNIATVLSYINTGGGPVQPGISYMYATLYYNTPGTASADIQEFVPIGTQNHKFNGSKLVGSAINVDSAQTTDGGPVVKTTPVNPNQIVFANNQLTTINRSTTGVRSRSI